MTNTNDESPHTYVIWRKSQLCLHCSTLHEWSEVYAKTHLKARLNAGKHITSLRPLHTHPPQYNLPIETRCGDIEKIPFCHHCPDPTAAISTLPCPPSPEPPPPPPSWITATAAIPKRPAAAKKPSATLDDLIQLINL